MSRLANVCKGAAPQVIRENQHVIYSGAVADVSPGAPISAPDEEPYDIIPDHRHAELKRVSDYPVARRGNEQSSWRLMPAAESLSLDSDGLILPPPLFFPVYGFPGVLR